MSRYIDAEVLDEKISDRFNEYYNNANIFEVEETETALFITEDIQGIIYNLPTADVVEVVHAEPVKFYCDPFTGKMITTCSYCDGKISSKDKWCKHCGAKMDGEKVE